jgi:hypothetical protein
MNVDLWSKEKWQEELSRHQVRTANKGVLQVACVVIGVLYLCYSCCADLGDDMSDIPEPSAAWLHTVVGRELAHI